MRLDNITLLASTACGLLILAAWHRRPDNFDLRHLLIDSKTNRVSLMKCGQLFALLVSTWVLIRETNNNRLTEWLFLTYMGCWAGANIANKWVEKNGNLRPDLSQGNKEQDHEHDNDRSTT